MRVILVLTVVIFLLQSPSGFAWQDDFHYGLTKWLAVQAGFSADSAEHIAHGNLQTDSGILSAIHSVSLYACLKILLQESASEVVQTNHFPSEPIVSQKRVLPKDRKVKANSSAATEKVIKATSQRIELEDETNLYLLGRALHPLQDSWSHQGEPDVPYFHIFFPQWSFPKAILINCDEELAWSHPKARGGFMSPKADLTHHWSDMARDAAEETYHYLREFLTIYPELRQSEPKAWCDIEEEVLKLLISDTKSKKELWFQNSGVDIDTSFISNLSVRDGEQRFEQYNFENQEYEYMAGIEPPNIDVPPEVESFYENLFNDWLVGGHLVEGHMDAVAKKYLDIPLLASNLELPEEWFPDDDRTPALTSVAMWGVRDQGWVVELGQVVNAENVDEVYELNKITKYPDNLATYTSVREAMLPFTEGGKPYLIIPIDNENPGVYLAIARLKHAPGSVLILSAAEINGSWRAIALDWIVEH